MEKFPKFIIYDDILIIRKVTFHKELLGDVYDKSKVKGGGMFKFDFESKTFTLFGESVDFGQATFDDISKCVKNKNIVTSITRRPFNDLINTNFVYDSGSEIIKIDKDGK